LYARNKLQKGVAAIPLPSLSAFISAFSNDSDPDWAFAQLVFVLGRREDVLICISTSGNSKNIVNAASVAKSLGITTVALTGEKDSKLSEICDVCIGVPETETFKVQELHLPVYHAICAEAEEKLFSEEK